MNAIGRTTVGGSPYPDGLTEREVQVLRLMARGKRNRQIAADLAISVNTVDRHVSSILKKTGSANRTAAAMYAARRGLVVLDRSCLLEVVSGQPHPIPGSALSETNRFLLFPALS